MTTRVAVAIIWQSGKILACQRKKGSRYELKWEFPGGKVEKGESDVDALRRELREELAVDAHRVDFYGRYDHAYPDGPSVSLNFYHVNAFAGEPQNRIFRQIIWAQITELDRFDFLEGDRPIVERLMAEYGSGAWRR